MAGNERAEESRDADRNPSRPCLARLEILEDVSHDAQHAPEYEDGAAASIDDGFAGATLDAGDVAERGGSFVAVEGHWLWLFWMPRALFIAECSTSVKGWPAPPGPGRQHPSGSRPPSRATCAES